MVLFVPHRCQPWRHKKAECTLCLDLCPEQGCLKREGSRITVDRQLCTSCGVCTTACPSGALVMESLDDRELLSRLVRASDGKPLALECALGPVAKGRSHRQERRHGASEARVPCLAILNESHLVHLATNYSLTIYLDCSGCEACALKSAPGIISRSVRNADNLLCALGAPGKINISTEPTPESSGRGGFFNRSGRRSVLDIAAKPEYSRRELFAFLGDRARTKAVESILGREAEGDEASPGQEGAVPDRRRMLLDVLKGREGASAVLLDGEFPVRSLSLEGCVVCRTCESFCPTGALKRVERECETAIDFEMARCVGCNQCGELCPEEAIRYAQKLDVGSMAERGAVTLASTPRLLCEGCKKEYHPEIDKDGCPTCRKRGRFDDTIKSILFGRGGHGARPDPTRKEVV